MANPKTVDMQRMVKELQEYEDHILQQSQAALRQHWAQMMQQAQGYFGGLSYAGISRVGYPGQIVPLDPAPAQLPDPHKALAAQIAQLKEAQPVKIGERVPDLTHTLTGWRGWSVKNERLQALGQSNAWDPKKAKPAKCTSAGKSHRAPSKECQCGYWSFKSMEILTEALKGYVNSVVVVGAVEIWGRVIECENGYRSEFAYPKELWLLKPDLEYLSWAYGVPVRKVAGEQ